MAEFNGILTPIEDTNESLDSLIQNSKGVLDIFQTLGKNISSTNNSLVSQFEQTNNSFKKLINQFEPSITPINKETNSIIKERPMVSPEPLNFSISEALNKNPIIKQEPLIRQEPLDLSISDVLNKNPIIRQENLELSNTNIPTEEEIRTPSKPSRNDVIKANDTGALFVADTLLDAIDKKSDKGSDEGDEGGFLSNLFGNNRAGGLSAILSKAIPIAGIVASVGWAIAEGIKAMNLSDEWGTSKVSSFIGGFLGGTGSGFQNAFKQAGKWALMGASIGFLAGGPIGALAGGLIGGAVGAVIGFIGGEKIAQGIQNISSKLGEIWSSEESNLASKIGDSALVIMNGLNNGIIEFMSTIPEMITLAITKDEETAKTVKSEFKNLFKNFNLISWITGSMTIMKEGFDDLFSPSSTSFKDKLKGIGKILFSLPISMFNSLKDFMQGSSLIRNLSEGIGNIITGIVSSISSKITDFGIDTGIWFSNLFNTVFTFIGEKITQVRDLGIDIKDKVVEFLKGVMDIGVAIIRDGIDLGTSIKDNVVGFFNNIFDSVSSKIMEEGSLSESIISGVKEKIIDPVLGIFSKVNTFFDYIGTYFEEGLGRGIVSLGSDFAKGEFNTGLEEYRQSLDPTPNTPAYSTPPYEERTRDAIIRPDGGIIRTHPEDTLIASKNPISRIEPQRGNTGTAGIEVLESKFDRLISLIESLIGETRSNRPISNELDQLRNYSLN